MDVLRYRGRVVIDADVAFIRDLISAHPTATRRALSLKLCAAWNWIQPNGTPRDMVCRGLLLALHRAGHIELPPPQYVRSQAPWKRQTPARVDIDTTPLGQTLDVVRPLIFRQVRRTADESLCNSLIEQYHYLGYTQPVGEHLKYLVYTQGRPIACLAWSSAPRHLGCRDRFIGWSAEARRKNIRFIAYNPRYLILPWVQVPHLASHILGQMAKRFCRGTGNRSTDTRCTSWRPSWTRSDSGARATGRPTGWFWGVPPAGAKTIRPWRPNRPIKEMLGYPLRRDFRAIAVADHMKKPRSGDHRVEPMEEAGRAFFSAPRRGRLDERGLCDKAQGADRILRLPDAAGRRTNGTSINASAQAAVRLSARRRRAM